MNERGRALAVGLTGQEAECWELTGTLAGRLYHLPTLHETDWHDLAHAIHIIQNKLMARPAYRKYLQLAAELPAMFGFTVYSSIPPMGAGTGDIPFPTPEDKQEGGHAVVAVGYDDQRKIGADTGALLIRNSWGTGWGEKGYGWLPYSYVTAEQAFDFWSLVQADFVDSDLFD
jgi:hypothetical protein